MNHVTAARANPWLLIAIVAAIVLLGVALMLLSAPGTIHAITSALHNSGHTTADIQQRTWRGLCGHTARLLVVCAYRLSTPGTPRGANGVTSKTPFCVRPDR